MTSRALASIALGAAVILGATGCSMISPQATTIQYSAAEGINIADSSGPVKIRNLFVVIDKEGMNGNLVGNFINPTSDDQTVAIEVGEGSNAVVVDVAVPANSTVVLGGEGDNGEDPVLLEGIDVGQAASIKSIITSGGESPETFLPIMSGKLPYFENFVPSE